VAEDRRFREVQRYAAVHGFFAGFPNFHEADYGDGVFLAGDMVAAPGCLSEIAWASAVEASRLAVGAVSRRAGSAVS